MEIIGIIALVMYCIVFGAAVVIDLVFNKNGGWISRVFFAAIWPFWAVIMLAQEVNESWKMRKPKI